MDPDSLLVYTEGTHIGGEESVGKEFIGITFCDFVHKIVASMADCLDTRPVDESCALAR